MLLQTRKLGHERRKPAIEREANLLGETVATPTPAPPAGERQSTGDDNTGRASRHQANIVRNGAIHHQLEAPGKQRNAQESQRFEAEGGKSPRIGSPGRSK